MRLGPFIGASGSRVRNIERSSSVGLMICGRAFRIATSYIRATVSTRAQSIESARNSSWPVPHRVLRNKAVEDWEAAGRPASGQRPGEGTIIGTIDLFGTTMEVPKYSSMAPTTGFAGD